LAQLIDFHCHVDLYPDFEKFVGEIERHAVYTLAVTTTPRAWNRNRDVCAETKYLRAALGLHPQLVEEHFEEIALWEKRLEETRYVGEIGLDAGPRHFKSLDRQKQIFARILSACAEQGGKILSIHSVRAAAQVLDMLEKYLPAERGVAVLHWFSGTMSEAKLAIEFGCYFSVNEQMAKTPNGAKLIGAIPLDRILTETDGPFTQVNGAPATPMDVSRALAAIASCVGKAEADVAKQVLENFKRIVLATGPVHANDPVID
jgi:TatD DNase family protein